MATKPFIDLVLAADENDAIGHDRIIPWVPIPTDYRWFTTLGTTTKDPLKRIALIVGRLSFEDVMEFLHKNLSRWYIIVITHQSPEVLLQKYPNIDRDHLEIVHSFDQAAQKAKSLLDTPSAMVERALSFGGSSVYEQALASKLVKRVYLTRVFAKVPDCNNIVKNFDLTDFHRIKRSKDEVLSELDDQIIEENGWKYQFQVYERKDL